jgi:FkbM family methyltransferase
MLDRLKTRAALVARALSRPNLAIIAVRQRGLRNMLDAFFRGRPGTAAALAFELQSRLPPTPANLRDWYRGIDLLPSDDQDCLKTGLPSGEQFYVRRARAWQDIGTLYEVFIDRVYADHPPLSGKMVLDVGANIGDTAVYFAERGATVVAFEPDPEMCALARRNLAVNGLRADIRNAGIGGCAATVRLSVSHDGADGKSATLFGDGESNDPTHPLTREIDIVALSDVLSELGHVELLKIDCQGCEYPALRSLSPEQLRAVRHIVMEYHGERESLASQLRDSGFSVRFKRSTYVYAARVGDREGSPTANRE